MLSAAPSSPASVPAATSGTRCERSPPAIAVAVSVMRLIGRTPEPQHEEGHEREDREDRRGHRDLDPHDAAPSTSTRRAARAAIRSTARPGRCSRRRSRATAAEPVMLPTVNGCGSRRRHAARAALRRDLRAADGSLSPSSGVRTVVHRAGRRRRTRRRRLVRCVGPPPGPPSSKRCRRSADVVADAAAARRPDRRARRGSCA